MNYKRNELGLLEGVNYEYNEDGSVNWRAMIAAEHLYPNKGWFEMRNQPMPQSIEGLADNQLLIKLSGIKELAKLRGFNRVHYDVIKCEIDHVSVKCEINWIPNFENPKQESDFLPPSTSFEDLANATSILILLSIALSCSNLLFNSFFVGFKLTNFSNIETL